jgi:hypothetical protein
MGDVSDGNEGKYGDTNLDWRSNAVVLIPPCPGYDVAGGRNASSWPRGLRNVGFCVQLEE